MDERVEGDILKRLETVCEEAKKERANFLAQSKKYADNEVTRENFIIKAENVDM